MPLSRIRKTLSELGTANGLLYLAGRALQAVTGGRAFIVRYHFVAQPVPASPSQYSRQSPSTRVRQVTPDDPIVASFPRPPSVIEQRFANGNTCFVAENNGRFAGFLWLARNAYEEDEIRCRYELFPPEICAWDFDVYVEPEYRIGRTFARLWEAANAHLAQTGVRWSLSRISAFNASSLAAHRQLGIKPITNATFISIGSVQISLLAAAPIIHLSLSHAYRPLLTLSPPQGAQL